MKKMREVVHKVDNRGNTVCGTTNFKDGNCHLATTIWISTNCPSCIIKGAVLILERLGEARTGKSSMNL